MPLNALLSLTRSGVPLNAHASGAQEKLELFLLHATPPHLHIRVYTTRYAGVYLYTYTHTWPFGTASSVDCKSSS